MHNLLSLLASTPVPTETADPASTFYSPGTLGFIMTFFVSAGAIALIFDMVRRVRRVRYRAEIEAKLDAQRLPALQLGQQLFLVDEINGAGRKTALMLPFTLAAVPTVDLGAGRVIVDLPEGLD